MLLKLKFTSTSSVVVCGLCTVSGIALHIYFICKEIKKEIMAEQNVMQSCWIVTHNLWSMFFLKRIETYFFHIFFIIHLNIYMSVLYLRTDIFYFKIREYSFKLFSKFAVTLYRYIMNINYGTENESYLYIFPSRIFISETS